MILLSIDPGYVTNGYLIYDVENKKILISSTLITKQINFEDKLVCIYDCFNSLILKFNPTILIYEQPTFINKGIVGSNINRAIGVITLIAKLNKLNIISFTPTQIKKQITNDGKADKNKVAQYVSDYFQINNEFKTNHESDAYAIAATYLKHLN